MKQFEFGVLESNLFGQVLRLDPEEQEEQEEPVQKKALTEKQIGFPDFLWFGECQVGYVVDRIELQSSRGGER